MKMAGYDGSAARGTAETPTMHRSAEESDSLSSQKTSLLISEKMNNNVIMLYSFKIPNFRSLICSILCPMICRIN